MESTMYSTLILTLCCFTHIFSSPVPISKNCSTPCEWTPWFNVDHPTNQTGGGDLETLDNIRAHGHNVCRTPKAINCRSSRFPYVPFKELQYNTQCDKDTGLICLNKNNEDNCVDFEVQLLCCPCDQVSDSPVENKTQIPTVPTESTASQCENSECTWTQWFNTHQPTTGPDGGDFENISMIINRGDSGCAFPQAVQCRLARFPYIPLRDLYYTQECSVSHGLLCLNKNQQDDTCLDYEARFLCCTCIVFNPTPTRVLPGHIIQPITEAPFEELVQETAVNRESSPTKTDKLGFVSLKDSSVSISKNCSTPCEWTPWFNVDHPTNQPDGGDLETLDNIRAHGHNVCRTPKAINCRSSRFPYVPFKELQYNTQCDKDTGLICLNKNNEDNCVDFEVQLLCCPCNQVSDSPVENKTQIPTVPTESTASQCENSECTWTQWFNTHQPTTGPDGGDFENISMIINRGDSGCAFPQAVQCRLARFPYIPLRDLYYTQECSVSHGLLCLNKNQQGDTCLDYEARFLCCTCIVFNPTPTRVLPGHIIQPITEAPFEELVRVKAANRESSPTKTDKLGFLSLKDGSGSNTRMQICSPPGGGKQFLWCTRDCFPPPGGEEICFFFSHGALACKSPYQMCLYREPAPPDSVVIPKTHMYCSLVQSFKVDPLHTVAANFLG